MLKKIALSFVLILSVNACIPVHTAKRINTHEISDGGEKYLGLKAYTFQYEGNNFNYFESIRDFFELSNDANLSEFTTNDFIEGKELKFFISRDVDSDSYLDLTGLIFGNHDHENQNNSHSVNDKDGDISIKDTGKIHYVYIQILDEHGNDLFATDSFWKSIAVQKLKKLQDKINNK